MRWQVPLRLAELLEQCRALAIRLVQGGDEYAGAMLCAEIPANSTAVWQWHYQAVRIQRFADEGRVEDLSYLGQPAMSQAARIAYRRVAALLCSNDIEVGDVWDYPGGSVLVLAKQGTVVQAWHSSGERVELDTDFILAGLLIHRLEDIPVPAILWR